MEQKDLLYSRILADISNGYSKIYFYKEKLYYKHPNIFDKTLLEDKYAFFEDRAVKQNKKTNDEITKEIETNDLWGKKEEKEIKNKRDYLNGLNDNLQKAKSKEEESIIKKNIAATNKEINEILQKKEKFYESSVETYIELKLREYEPLYLCYKNRELTQRFFTEEEYEELTSNEVYMLNFSIYSTISKLAGNNIEKLILSDFFYSIFMSYNKYTIPSYFKTPPQERSTFQNTLTYYWQLYKEIVPTDTPSDVRQDPKKLINYIKQKNKRENRADSGRKEADEMNIKDLDFSKVKSANDID